jgi:EF hand
MKRLVLVLLVCAACKSSSDNKPAPAAAAADDSAQTAPRARPTSRVAPALPNDVEGSNAPSLPEERWGRHHRGDWDGSAMSDEQREAMFKERAEKMRTRMDANGDGKLSYDELQNAQGRMHFDDPASIDTNHDGDISADELEAAMKARREAFRAQRQAAQGGSGGAPPAPPAPPPAPDDNSATAQ